MMQKMLTQMKSENGRAMCSLALCILLFAHAGSLSAGDMPPFPFLYGGQALVGDEPIPEGTILFAKVGGYQTWTAVEKDGNYRNLLVAPPNAQYYNMPVTFHVMDTVAAEHDVFSSGSAPVFKSQSFDLHFPQSALDYISELYVAAIPTRIAAATLTALPTATLAATPTATLAATPVITPTDKSNGRGALFGFISLIGLGMITVLLIRRFGLHERMRKWLA